MSLKVSSTPFPNAVQRQLIRPKFMVLDLPKRCVCRRLIDMNLNETHSFSRHWTYMSCELTQSKLCRPPIFVLLSPPFPILRTDIFFLNRIFPINPGDLAPARLKELFKQTLTRLNGIKIRVFYLHAPDHSVPYEDTVSAVNDLYKGGHLWV